MTELLLPNVIDPLVKGTVFFGKIRHAFQTTSTNVSAMQAGAAGEPEGAVFLAEEQTGGKGRGGHSWHSEPGAGLYCSVLLRPQMAPADAVPMSMMAGLAAAAAVEEVTGLKPDLRWPNDLLLGPSHNAMDQGHPKARKFCGILAELNAETTRVRYLVAGIGINVNHASFPPEIADIATSLRIEGGREYSRVELAGALLRELGREYGALRDGVDQARKSIFRRFEERSSYARGLRVRVEEEDGYEGITEGLDERGFLRVRTERGLRTVLHGGVRALTDADADRF